MYIILIIPWFSYSSKKFVSEDQLIDLRRLPDTYLICFLNGFDEAKEQLEHARALVKSIDEEAYTSLKESLRVIRKVRYN